MMDCRIDCDGWAVQRDTLFEEEEDEEDEEALDPDFLSYFAATSPPQMYSRLHSILHSKDEQLPRRSLQSRHH